MCTITHDGTLIDKEGMFENIGVILDCRCMVRKVFGEIHVTNNTGYLACRST